MKTIKIKNYDNAVVDINFKVGNSLPCLFFGGDEMEVSDGYHTMDELYDHRVTLFISLLKNIGGKRIIWKSRLHSDNSSYEGWFILGMNKEPGEQITYHIPIKRWEECSFAEELEKAPEWDGHTSDDVLNRIKEL